MFQIKRFLQYRERCTFSDEMNMDYVDYENGGEHYEDEDYGVYYEDPYEHQQEFGF